MTKTDRTSRGKRTGVVAPPRPDATAPPFPLERDIFYLMTHVNAAYANGISDELKRTQLRHPEWRCLAVLHERNGASIQEVAVQTCMRQSTISRVLERMERAGLVTRTPRAEDGRVKDVFISPRGEEKLAQLLPLVRAQYLRATQDLSDDTVDELRTALQHIIENLRRFPLS